VALAVQATQAAAEATQTAAQQAATEESMYCVCLAAQKNVAFDPCGHACTCIECGKAISNGNDAACPVCRTPVCCAVIRCAFT
jgi:hypothetical protein